MTPERQTIFLFLAIGCVLVAATAVGMVLARRRGNAPDPMVDNLNQRIRAWWVMVILIGIAFLIGRIGVIVLFALASFTALREFITLTETRRGDHYALVAAFFVVLPVQYYPDRRSTGTGSIRSSSRSTPSCFMPIIAAFRADTTRFMERIAVAQWALMLAVFCVSHVPALLTLKIPGYEGRGLLLIAFLILVVQSSDVLQYVWGKLYGRTKIAPNLSPSKTWEGFLGGVGSASLIGLALYWITPFSPLGRAPDGVRRGADGFSRRARHVGDQARPRRQGLGRHDRRPRRHFGPARFRHLRRADFFPPDAVFLHGVRARARYSFAAAAGTVFAFGRQAKASPSPRETM